MVCVTGIDIVGSKLFNRPLLGAVDITGLLDLIVVTLALAQAQVLERHVSVDIVVTRLRPRARSGLRVFSSLVSLVLCVLLIYVSIRYAHGLQVSREGSMTIQVPLYPFMYITAFGFALASLVVLVQLITTGETGAKP
ncbi:MAG: TRAP transporter small permease [Moorellales bacterium]